MSVWTFPSTVHHLLDAVYAPLTKIINLGSWEDFGKVELFPWDLRQVTAAQQNLKIHSLKFHETVEWRSERDFKGYKELCWELSCFFFFTWVTQPKEIILIHGCSVTVPAYHKSPQGHRQKTWEAWCSNSVRGDLLRKQGGGTSLTDPMSTRRPVFCSKCRFIPTMLLPEGSRHCSAELLFISMGYF